MEKDVLSCCNLCPRKCGADRTGGKIGFCGATDKVKIARSALHFWEEPCISGDKGSGTVFFSHCTLKCVYCQNYKISTENQGALNINLVTPTHFVPQIIEALKIAKKKGLTLPILYNTSGYENPETLELLRGYVDIFLPVAVITGVSPLIAMPTL